MHRSQTINLSIAHIIVSIRSLSEEEKIFLQQKYADYIDNTKRKPDVRIDIFVKRTTANRRISYSAWHVFIPSIQENFLDFNQELKFILSGVLLRHNGALLHGSVLYKNKRAYVFLGPEGAGKSTMRELLEPEYDCLGDDSVFIRVIRNTAYVFGSPLYQRTKKAYSNIRVKIFGIFKLQKEPFLAIQKLIEKETILHMCTNTVTTDVTKSTLERIYRFAMRASSLVPSFSVSFKNERGVAALLPYAKKLLTVQEPDLSKLPHPLNLQSQRYKNHTLTLFLQKELGDFHVIDEVSWQFEFPNMRTINVIAACVLQNNISGKHTEIIQSLLSKKSSFRSKVFVLAKEKTIFTLLDGTHHAVALQLFDAKLPYVPALVLETTKEVDVSE